MVRLIFLGTAGSSAVFTKQTRASGGIILQVEDLQFHIDPGPGALVKAKEFGVVAQNTTGILVSHNHLNHCNDLNAVVEAMTYGGIEQRGIVMGSKSALQDSETTTSFLTKHHRQLVERIIPLEKKHKIGLDLLEINSFPADHTDDHALGFKFFCPRLVISYSGDTAYSEELVDNLMGSDLLILNVPYPGNKSMNGNLDSEGATKIIAQVKPKLAILTHFGTEMLKADPLVEAREIQRATGVAVIAAQDGLSISPDNYKNRNPIKGFE
ncbi:MBL fold metallo-hydrolase [Candidatus Woesearchaeota archaeon]|nr:MBL fold metallo-hydrolase [Candidatus Woesearchaeota archaeon]